MNTQRALTTAWVEHFFGENGEHIGAAYLIVLKQGLEKLRLLS